MKELKAGLAETSGANRGLGEGPFEVVYHHRQCVTKKRRQELRKANDQRKRIMVISQSEPESPNHLPQLPCIDPYLEDQPWDILQEDSARFKIARSSTHTLPSPDEFSFEDSPLPNPTRSHLTELPITEVYSLFAINFQPFAYQLF